MKVKWAAATEMGFSSFNATGAERLVTRRDGDIMAVRRSGTELLRLRIEQGIEWRLSLTDAHSGSPAEFMQAISAAFEGLLAMHPEIDRVLLTTDSWSTVSELLCRTGIAATESPGVLTVRPELFWQLPDPWLAQPNIPAFPQRHVLTNGKRHPQRPPKPTGRVYARFIPWLNHMISFRVATIENDLERFHRWMNDPRIAQFWKEEGDLEKHHRYLNALLADPHIIPLIGCFDGTPFGYFEIYWAKENRLGPYYDADDYDRGWHVVVGEDPYRGRQWITAWLPSLMHYLFLDDCRTQRIVGEPQADHHQQIHNLEKSGFAKVKHFDFPHKRAMLMMLLRERFFNDRLWAADFQSALSQSTDSIREPLTDGDTTTARVTPVPA